MRVLFIGQSGYYGLTPISGAESYAHDLMKHLLSEGFEVSAVYGGSGPIVEVDGVRVHRRRPLDKIQDLSCGADVIITQLGATPIAKRISNGKPVVQLIHNTSKFTVGFMGSGCDLAVYNSLWIQEHHQQQASSKLVYDWKTEKKQAVRFRTASEWPSIITRPPAVEQPQYGGNPGGKITLVNMNPNKGPDVFYGLAKANPHLQFLGVVGGYDQDKHVYQTMDNVLIHPHTQDVEEFYSQTAILIVPSIYESYSRVAVEAMARGIPVLATSTPGTSECIQDGGYLIEDRENLESWQVGLDGYLSEYEEASTMASLRYSELLAQTKTDLDTFTQAMEGLCH